MSLLGEKVSSDALLSIRRVRDVIDGLARDVGLDSGSPRVFAEFLREFPKYWDNMVIDLARGKESAARRVMLDLAELAIGLGLEAKASDARRARDMGRALVVFGKWLMNRAKSRESTESILWECIRKLGAVLSALGYSRARKLKGVRDSVAPERQPASVWVSEGLVRAAFGIASDIMLGDEDWDSIVIEEFMV